MRPLIFALLSLQLVHAAVTVTVSPASPSIRAGGTKPFTAQVSGTTNHAVTWSVNGIPGGNTVFGQIGSSGGYTAPSTVPSENILTITAVSGADQTASGSTTVTLLNPVPAIQSASPGEVNINAPFLLIVTGTGFVPSSKVALAGTALKTGFISSTQLKCSGMTSAAVGSNLALTVANPDPGGQTSNSRNITVLAPITVTLSPSTSPTIRPGDSKQFSASVQNAVNKSVRWFVNGVQGGDGTHGTIDPTGMYQAPTNVPVDAPIVAVASVEDVAAGANVTVALLNPLPVISSVTPASVNYGSISITVNGSGFASGAQVMFGATALSVGASSATQITATGTASAVAGGVVPVTVSNPNPGAAVSNAAFVSVSPANPKLTYNQAYRFLEQATFGPDPAAIAHLQQVGFDQWFTEQFAATPSDYTDPPDTTTGYSPTQNQFFVNALTGPDQLRQRVAFALSQIFVVSGVKVPKDVAVIPYLRILSSDAFGSYLTLMQDISLNPAMGNYLDMVNNDKFNAKTGVAPNENYARELMQLFTLGLVMLNQDGSATTSPPTATYDQTTVSTMARVFTGWTYPPIPGTITAHHNPENYFAPMVAIETNHDGDSKTLFGSTFNGTAEQGLDSALNLIFNHQNVGPFVALRLIQHLVKSNPSPAYINDVAAVFNNPDDRGNLQAVVKAVLMHTEARQADTSPPAASEGHLREPVIFMTHFLRSLGAGIAAGSNPLTSQGNNMGQLLFNSASVFNYYSPFYRTAGGTLAGPEFQLMNPATSIMRANFIESAVTSGLGHNITLDLTPYIALAAQPGALLSALDNALLHGRMQADPQATMRNSILTALNATTDPKVRAQNAIFLVASSSLYQVEE